MTTYSHIDIPFNQRHTCWFCGEPSSDSFEFPRAAESIAKLEHPPLAIPACGECQSISYPKSVTSIWVLRDKIKQALINKYAKHLGIGENWTEQELIDSEFSGAILGGFGKSAWKMYQIAKQRVDYQGWPLAIDTIPLNVYDESAGFEFDGTRYANVYSCIDYFAKAAGVNKELLTQLVDIVTPARFGYALRIAKLNKSASKAARLDIVDEVLQQESEQEEIELERQHFSLTFDEKVQLMEFSEQFPIFYMVGHCLTTMFRMNIRTFKGLVELSRRYWDKSLHDEAVKNSTLTAKGEDFANFVCIDRFFPELRLFKARNPQLHKKGVGHEVYEVLEQLGLLLNHEYGAIKIDASYSNNTFISCGSILPNESLFPIFKGIVSDRKKRVAFSAQSGELSKVWTRKLAAKKQVFDDEMSTLANRLENKD